jgi:hypothetical protein
MNSDAGVFAPSGGVSDQRRRPNPPLDRTAGMNGAVWIELSPFARGRSAAIRSAAR